jgi:hypothetical protein
MESPEGLANAVLSARLGSAKRDAAGWEQAAYRELAARQDACDRTWYWRMVFRSLRGVFEELAKKHPTDPLFAPTGRRQENGQPELEYHRLFEKLVSAEKTKLPRDVRQGHRLTEFLKKIRI